MLQIKIEDHTAHGFAGPTFRLHGIPNSLGAAKGLSVPALKNDFFAP